MFEKFNFTESQVKKYHIAAVRDLIIARDIENSDVKFRFAYDAILKLAIAVCAKNGLRVKSRKGHHIELIKELAKALNNKEIESHGNRMRSKRNFDLYSGGILISEKEASESFEWVKTVFNQTETIFENNLKLF